MRSRYSAFATGDVGYLTHSWDPATVPEFLEVDPVQEWVGLEILSVRGGGAFDDGGIVEFRASFTRNGGPVRAVTENSSFRRSEGRWVYAGAVGSGQI